MICVCGQLVTPERFWDELSDIIAKICDLYTIIYLSLKLSALGTCQSLTRNLSNAYLTSRVKEKKSVNNKQIKIYISDTMSRIKP